jgi:hypothetical protein
MQQIAATRAVKQAVGMLEQVHVQAPERVDHGEVGRTAVVRILAK